MCDCYHAPCKVCGTMLPVHLGDFNTDREEIEVFCEDHLPEYNVRVFTLKEPAHEEHAPKKLTKEERLMIDNELDSILDKDEHYDAWMGMIFEKRDYPVGWKMGIRNLTKNAEANNDMNYPNLGVDTTIDTRRG